MQAVTALARKTRALEAAKRDLQRSNVELDNFASVVAHDIRRPLNRIGLLAQLLGDRRSRKSESDAADWLAKIQSEVTW
jgi:light-regulated signal transduction histidine kinase (bacteriophytochrome)